MSLSTINNGDSGLTCLNAINAAINATNAGAKMRTVRWFLNGSGSVPSIVPAGMTAGDRVLCTQFTNPAENGIYIVAASTWQRATDYDDWETDIVGSLVYVQDDYTDGSNLALDLGKGHVYACAVVTGGILGTTPILFNRVNGLAGNDIAFIHSTLGDDDFAGTMGSPFATAQAAYDAGYSRLVILYGDAGTLDVVEGRTNLWIHGLGSSGLADSGSAGYNPELGTYAFAPEVTVRNNTTTNHVHIYSNKGVLINLAGEQAGNIGIEMACFNAQIGSVNVVGAAGANGANRAKGATGGNDQPGADGEAGGDGEDGGRAGIIAFQNCDIIGPVTMTGGIGGNGGTGGDGGDGGPLVGDEGTNSGVPGLGGAAGDGGQGGELVLVHSTLHCTPDLSPGDPGTPGTNGSPGTPQGTGNAQTQSGTPASGSPGTASLCRLILSVSTNDYVTFADTVEVRGSVTNGSFVASA